MPPPKQPKRSAADYLPPTRDLEAMRAAAQRCEGCDLYQNATQAVFGEGSPRARVMLVGEQPGDQEDRQGHPFVGPAGDVLDRALAEAGIRRGDAYVTNAVKHFSWEPRGKRRIHKKPRISELKACRPWLDAEIARVKPRVLVCLGATAVQSVLGGGVQVTRDRGQLIEREGQPPAIVTRHPSSVLRQQEAESRRLAYQELVDDLRLAARHLAGRGSG
jgi:uracil-DNA glycosylase